MKDRIAASVFWMVWSRGAMQIFSFAVTLIVARFLSPSDYGLMAMAAVWTSILGLVATLGLGSAVIQFKDLNDGELNLCNLLMNVTAWATYGVLFFSAPHIAAWFKTAELEVLLRVTGLMMPITALSSVHANLLMKRLRFDGLSKADIAASAVTIPLVFVMAWQGFGVWALVCGALGKPVVTTILVRWYERWIPGLRCDLARFVPILRFSAASFGSHALWATYDQADSFVLGKVAGDQVLGYYTMGRDLARVAVVKISAIVNSLAVPVMAELQNDCAAMRSTLLRSVRLVSAVSFPFCVGLAVTAHDVVFVALSQKWLPIVPIVQILSLAALIKSLDALLSPVLRARYRAEFLAGYNAVLLVAMPAMFLCGAYFASGVGVAVVWLIGYPAIMWWMAREALREIELPWKMLFAQLKTPFLASIGMALCVQTATWLLPQGDGRMTLVRLCVEVVVGACAYGIVVWLHGGQLRKELLEMFGWVMRRRGHSPAK